MNRAVSILLPLLGLTLFAVIVWQTGAGRILEVFRTADPRGLALSPLALAIILLVRGVRWQTILRGAGVDYSVWRSTAVWSIGFFASSVTPAKAGDAIRAVYIQRDSGKSFGEAFVTVFIDRLWDLGFILVAGLVTVVVFSRQYIEIPSSWIVVGASLVIAVGVYVVSRKEIMQRLLGPLFNLLVPARFKEMFSVNFHSFYSALQSYGGNRGTHVTVMLLTLLCWSLIFLLAFGIAWTLGIEISLGYLVLIWPIVTLVELVPVSVSGLGTRDATLIYFFSVVGIASASAVGFSIAYLIIGTYLTALIGFLFWLRHPVRLSAGES